MKASVSIAIILSAFSAGSALAQSQPPASPPSPVQSPRSLPSPRLAVPAGDPAPPSIWYVPRRELKIAYLTDIEASALYRSALSTADCLINVSGERVADALAEGEPSDVAIGDDVYTRYRACPHVSDPLLSAVIDGAVAERLLDSEGVRYTEPRAIYVDVDKAEQFHGDLAQSTVGMRSIARCAAVYSPGLAMEVLNTEIGSEDEATALSQLFAQTPECGLRDRPVSIPATVQRSEVASALYSWTHGRA